MEHPIQTTFLQKAYRNAGIDPGNWHPERGFRANESTLERLYLYYQALYFKQPGAFWWAGLARLTGGQVLFGMRNAVRIMRDPCVMTQQIVAVAKDIFENLAWQHELFLHDPELLFQVCETIHTRHEHPYADCWRLLYSGDAERIGRGNRMLLENEQCHTIQPHYDIIRKDNYARPYFRLTRFVMRNIHPHHRRFIVEFPLGDITRFADRWRWISHPRGMWARWVAAGETERSRLVALSNEAVVKHRW
ncbi:MAG: hypothetical protein SFV22_19450 [Saprospiraceae bacterium]|nr:hypothetical protein [Saprospiraceae bacterium]